MDEIARGELVLETTVDESRLQSAVAGINSKLQRAIKPVTTKLNVDPGSNTALSRIVQNLKGTKDGIEGANVSAKQLLGTFSTLATVGTAALAGLLTKGVQFAGSLEQQNIALTGLQGQLGASAAESTKQIQQLANLTPFDFNTAFESTIKLSSSMNLNLKDTLGWLTDIAAAGAAVGASSEQINAAALAISQISARGKLGAQDLHQLSSALPNLSEAKVYTEIAKNMGVTEQAARDLGEQGLIPADIALKSIHSTIQQVPGAAGALDRQAGSLNATLSNLSDTFKRSLGQAILDAIEKAGGMQKVTESVTNVITDLVPRIGDLTKTLIEAAPNVTKMVDALLPLVDAAAKVVGAVDTTIGAVQKLDDFAQGKHGHGNQPGNSIIDRILGFGGSKIPSWLKDTTSLLPETANAAAAAGKTGSTGFNELFLKPAAALFGKVGEAATTAVGSIAAFTGAATNLDKVRTASEGLKASEKALADLRRVTGQELQDNVIRAETNLAATRLQVRAAADSVKTAELALSEAQRGVGLTTYHLNELTKQRNRLLADTGAAAREVADAEATLARTGAELVDQDERRTEIQRDLLRLAQDGPDKLAAADRSIERAKIGLNTATREQINLENELHNAQVANVDLTGLTPAQIKLKLAQVRAQIDSQRLSKGTLKTEQEIRDEVETASLNKLDSEQTLKDAIQGRADLELSLNVQKREDEEALKALNLDHEASLRRQFEQQQELSRLRSGDTETARTLKGLNDDIATATDDVQKAVIAVHTATDGVTTALQGQQTLTLDIRDREREVETAKFNQKQHYQDIRDAQQKVKEDAQKVQEATATTLGDTIKINDALASRIGLNASLLGQSPALTKNIVDSLLGAEKFGPFLPGSQQEKDANLRNTRGSKLTDILINHPDQLVAFLRSIGLPFAEGGVVNSETFARLGEAGREVVLPLTRPARMQDLLQNNQVLHPVLAALGRISLPTPKGRGLPTPTAALSVPTNSGSGNQAAILRTERRAEQKELAGFIADALVERGFNGTTIEEGAIQLQMPEGPNQDLQLRKLQRIVEDAIDKRMRR